MQFQLIIYFHCKAFHLLIRASAMMLSMYNLTSGRDSQLTGNIQNQRIYGLLGLELRSYMPNLGSIHMKMTLSIACCDT